MKQEKCNDKPYSLLIYGIPKIGLSTLASQMPDPLFLNLDDDLTYIMQSKEIKVNSWEDFLTAGSEISDGKHPSGWLVIAHIERLWQYTCDYVTSLANGKNGTKAENIAELSFSDWRQAIDTFECKLKKLLSMRNTVLLSHEIAETRNIRGLERTHFLANIERKAQLVVLNLVDAIGRLYAVEQDIRILSFVSQENQISGSRIPELQNRKFVFQDQDISSFSGVIDSIHQAHQSTRRNTYETAQGSEKSVKGVVFKRSHPAAH